MKNKTIITCAITGAATKKESTPFLPITPEQIALSGLEAANAGASVLHIHVRDPLTGLPSMKLEYYQEVCSLIRAKNSEVILNLTTGPGALLKINPLNPIEVLPGTRLFNAEQRVHHINIIKPDICTIDLNTMNLENGSLRINQIEITKKMIELVMQSGVKPELEIFNSGDMVLAKDFVKNGILAQTDCLWQIVMGTKYGWPADAETLLYASRQLEPSCVWSAFGIGKYEMPMVAQTWILGGHVRVGLEDNIYLSRGVLAESNAKLVEKASRIILDLGGDIANCTDARRILGLKNEE